MRHESYLAPLLKATLKSMLCLSLAVCCGQTRAATSFIDGFDDGGNPAPVLNDVRVVGDFDDGTRQGWSTVRQPAADSVNGVYTNINTAGMGSEGNGDGWIWLNTGTNPLFTVGELPGQYDIVQFDFRVDVPPPVDAAQQIDPRIKGRNFLQGTGSGGSVTDGVTYQPSSSFPIDNNWRTYTVVRDFNSSSWEASINRLRLDLFDGPSNSEPGSVLGTKWSVDNVVLGRTTSTLAFPIIEPTIPNLVENGDLSLTENVVLNSTDQTNAFNINGGNGNFGRFRGNTGDVVGWTPYNNNPNGIVEAVADGGALDLLNSANGFQGSFYLDTHYSITNEQFSLNSAGGYLNGLTQTDVLGGVTIDENATYELSFDLAFSESRVSNPDANLVVALTVGDGSTDPATAVAGSLFDVQLSNVNSGETQTLMISGADLKAAQDSGDPINLIAQSQVNTSIVNFPGTPVPNNHVDTTVFQQVQLDNFSLVKEFISPTGDVNNDGVLTAADLAVAQDYFDGNGGETALKRQTDLANAPSAPFAADILASLNLGDFDLNGDSFFDEADLTILEGLVPAVTLLGDANGDNTVDQLDLDILDANYGTTSGGTVATGDFNGDGAVDLLDLDILGENFGATASGTASVPEPTTLCLLAVGALAFRRRV